jgi:SSS family solute:Na+ symporter
VARVYIVSAVFAHTPQPSEKVSDEFFGFLSSGTAEEKVEVLHVLASETSAHDVSRIEHVLATPDADVHVAAAAALLMIERRQVRALGALDWCVVGLYGAVVLLIGWYYSRRPLTSDEYLLGGRRMKSWAIGLSLFATLVSIVSYVAVPGEMIKYGPMILAGYAAMPFVMYVAGWQLIPYIMKLRVTSAYEILDTRFGPSARLTGSLLFVCMRLLWMGAIIYTAANTILVPLLGIDSRYAPLLGAVIGAVTLIYTSMGGFRAVVVTDVVQTFILFASAILAGALITRDVGGVSKWFPTHWDPQWSPPRFWFDPKARVTFASAMVLTFLWWVCTCGSDQLAIQRYLATRDVKAARRSLAVSLVCDTLVSCFLSLLGFALLAYFRANPNLLPEGQTIGSAADQLFPRYIALGLPAGMAGLAVAGLLAAAMSALASGLNSTSTVIAVDLIGLQHHADSAKGNNARIARALAAIIGVFVILLSLGMAHVSGNLLEVTSKLIGVFVAPLFVLFFMAMFVPWASTVGTVTGALIALAVGCSIAFFHAFGLSFLWIMPCSLISGVSAAAAISAVWRSHSHDGSGLLAARSEVPISLRKSS